MRICKARTIVSTRTEEITAPDSSRHKVPLINCDALQYLRQKYEDENNLSGKSERLEKYADDQQEEEMDRVTESEEEIPKHESELNYPDYFDNRLVRIV